EVSLVVAALQQAYRLAYLDPLTDLPARRYFSRHLRSLRPPFAVAFVSIDRFWWIRDTYGDEVADQVVRAVASMLVRDATDRAVYRLGGEDFAVLLPGLDGMRARAVMEGLCSRVAAREFFLRSPARGKGPEEARKRGLGGEKHIVLSISAGLAAAETGPVDTTALAREADRALTIAIGAGGHRVQGDAVSGAPA
ncbi:MAG TPA: GGDEF domain-containing protein, partial [Gammaproteobacteria bacterium]|nr:GGDEF domain-containing protein [Gammaproteobacteria bacterium]